MINLEQLKLYLTLLKCDGGYLDGDELSDQLLNYLTKLQRFTFHIETLIEERTSDAALSTNEAIQRSFSGKHYQQVASVMCQAVNVYSYHCHIYSLPYDFDYFHDLNNCFRAGSFKKVRFLTMLDEYPFETALFRLISRDMPFLEQLKITNEHPQKHKQRSSEILVFPHVERLDLDLAHEDYVELFLLKTNTYLPRLSILHARYQILRKLRNSFDNDSSHFNIGGVLIRLT